MGMVFFLLESCIPSLHPIYTEDKLVVVKELPGTWNDLQTDGEAKTETWQFRSGEGKNYLLVHTDKQGISAAFDVHVVKLGSHFFLDFFPTDLPQDEKGNSIGGIVKSLEKVNEMQSWHLLPVHTFARLEVSQNELKINMFDPEFLANLLKNKQIRIKHEKTEDGYVLTASPEELQKFAEKYATEKEAYLDNAIVLKRKAR